MTTQEQRPPTPAIEIVRATVASSRKEMSKGEDTVARAINIMVRGHIETQGGNSAHLVIDGSKFASAALAVDQVLRLEATRWLSPYLRPAKPQGKIILVDHGTDDPAYNYRGNVRTLNIHYMVGSDAQDSNPERLDIDVSFDENPERIENTWVGIDYVPGSEQYRNGAQVEIADGKKFGELILHFDRLSRLQFIAELLSRATLAPVPQATTTS